MPGMDLPDWLIRASRWLVPLGAAVSAVWLWLTTRTRKAPALPPRPETTHADVDRLKARLDALPEGQPPPEPTDPEGLTGDEVDDVLTGGR